MKKKIWIPVVLIPFILIGLLTVYSCATSNGNGAEGETLFEFINKFGSSIAGKAFYMPPVDAPQNASYKNNAVASNSPKTKTFVVSGVGKNMKEAKKDALNKAYKLSGVHFTSSVSYNNGNNADEMDENYTEITDVVVEKCEVLSAKALNGVVNVKLKVTITSVPSAFKGRFQ